MLTNLFTEEGQQEDIFEMECHKSVKLLSKLFTFSLIEQEASQELVSPFSWLNFHSGELHVCDDFIMITYVLKNLKVSKSFTGEEQSLYHC